MAPDDSNLATCLLPPPARHAIRSVRLTVVEGSDRGQQATFSKPRILIGRADVADLRLGDMTVSKYHMEILLSGASLVVKDLSQTNGVVLSGARLKEATVSSGTVLILGRTHLRIEIGDGVQPLPATADRFGGLLGGAPVMSEVYARMERLAHSDADGVLFQGATGTGKEVAARALHEAGQRRRGRFVTLDCPALPPSLAEDLLFGHAKGAFTGAQNKQPGCFLLADGGTLFLDEIGDLPLDLQAKLLGVLERRCVRPLGDTREYPVDVRIFSATRWDLRQLINQGRFREDLYFRIAKTTLWMPGLEQHREDIPLLIQHFLRQLSPGAPPRQLAPDVLEILVSRPYPGNVRELRNVIEGLANVCEGEWITRDTLAHSHHRDSIRQPDVPPTESAAPRSELGLYQEQKRLAHDEWERGYLQRLMDRAGGKIKTAAALAALERHQLRGMLRKHGLYHEHREE